MKGIRPLRAAVLLAASVATGNGGPVDMSYIVATGNLRMMNQPGVRLISEDLRITIEREHVLVEVSYRLANSGETVSPVYAFPVDRFVSDDFEPLTEDITGFRIVADGVGLAPGQVLLDDTLSYELEGMVHGGRMLRSWLPALLHLEAGSETLLEVSYRVRPCFVDWENTKEPFVGHSYRYFRYLLDPSGAWGDGRVCEFVCTIDYRALVENGGEAVSLPEGGVLVEPGLLRLESSGFNLASAPPLEIVYDPWTWMRTEEMAARAVPSERVASVVSSPSLAPRPGIAYDALNLFDSDPATAFAADLYAGLPWVRLVLDDVELSCLAIVGGYAKSAEAWFDNARVAKVSLTLFRDGRQTCRYDVEIEDAGFPGDLPLARAVQMVYGTGEPAIVDSLLLEVTGVYPGRLYNDLCISEILLFE